MKKALVFLLVLSLVGTMAFAEITVGGWGRIDFITGSNTTNDTVAMYTGPSWASGARVGINFAGKSDNMGFNLNIDSNGGNTLAVGDQAKITAKINDMLTIELGKAQGDKLRGKLGGHQLIGSAGDENAIFKRFYPTMGTLINLTPVEGLYIGTALDPNASTEDKTAEVVMKNVQAGAGYTIPDVGLARVQYLGSNNDDARFVQVAFQLTAVKNLNADVGAKFALGKAQHSASGAVSYSADALGVMGRFFTAFGNSQDTDLDFSAQLTYKLTDPYSIGAEFGFFNALVEASREIQGGAYLRLSYGNGYVRAGFQGTQGLASGSKFDWAVPVRLEYWF
ncbi:MAG: hypothetical protein WHT84_12850 [Breznakiellaceae bacterium]